MFFLYILFFSILSYADEHLVEKGETLFSIAKKNNITVEKIQELNNLISQKIFIGQKLKISNKEIVDNLNDTEEKDVPSKIKTENLKDKSSIKVTGLKKFESKFSFPIIDGKIINNYKGKLKIIALKDNNVISSCNGKILFFGYLENKNLQKSKINTIIVECNDGNYIAYENLKEIEKFNLNERIIKNQILGQCDKIQNNFFRKNVKNECGINYSIISQNKRIYSKPEKMFIK